MTVGTVSQQSTVIVLGRSLLQQLNFGGKISMAGDGYDLNCCQVDFDCFMSG